MYGGGGRGGGDGGGGEGGGGGGGRGGRVVEVPRAVTGDVPPPQRRAGQGVSAVSYLLYLSCT